MKIMQLLDMTVDLNHHHYPIFISTETLLKTAGKGLLQISPHQPPSPGHRTTLWVAFQRCVHIFYDTRQ